MKKHPLVYKEQFFSLVFESLIKNERCMCVLFSRPLLTPFHFDLGLKFFVNFALVKINFLDSPNMI